LQQPLILITSSALVVNIDRPWLYAELFNDFEIDIAADAKYDLPSLPLSPRPAQIICD